jgi:hypothetical protein
VGWAILVAKVLALVPTEDIRQKPRQLGTTAARDSPLFLAAGVVEAMVAQEEWAVLIIVIRKRRRVRHMEIHCFRNLALVEEGRVLAGKGGLPEAAWCNSPCLACWAWRRARPSLLMELDRQLAFPLAASRLMVERGLEAAFSSNHIRLLAMGWSPRKAVRLLKDLKAALVAVGAFELFHNQWVIWSRSALLVVWSHTHNVTA